MAKAIITIGREHGSGGRTIARIVAERLGYDYYDGELVALAAKQSGLSEDFLKSEDEKPKNGFFFGMDMNSLAPTTFDLAYNAQADAIRAIGDKGGAVIVGRCADYILHDYPNLVRVFIYADEEVRVKRITEEYQEASGKDAAKLLARMDKKRAYYYNFNTQQSWGVAQNYDLCINSKIGLENVAGIIVNYAQHMLADNEKKGE